MASEWLSSKSWAAGDENKAMRVLLVHNFYGAGAPSGENYVVHSERDILAERGHEVVVYSRESDEIRAKGSRGAIIGGLVTPWNQRSLREVSRIVRQFRPDVMHVHNTFPLISPSVFSVGDDVAKVLTLHNYRLFCPAAIPLRDGEVCSKCIDARSSWASIRYGCYRNSRVATLPLAASVALHRAIGTWSRRVNRFVVLSRFQASVVRHAGLPAERVIVKPNFVRGQATPLPWTKRHRYVLFAGRFGEEKGVRTLLKAWKMWGQAAPQLHLAGDGELRPEVEAMANELPVKVLGRLSRDELRLQMAQAMLVVVPSEWWETFGMVVCEAYAQGTPVAVSNLGALPELVENNRTGAIFRSGDPVSLLDCVRGLWLQPGWLEEMGQAARVEFKAKYTESVAYDNLIDLYRSAIASVGRRGQRSVREK